MTRLLLLLLISYSFLLAQGRDFFPWWEMPIARDLNLSEEQMQKIQAIVREHRDKLVDLRGSLEKAENQLSDLINDERPDAQTVNGAIDRAVAARGELTRTFSQMGFKLRMVLTPQQWRELQRRRPRPPAPPPPPNRPFGPHPPGPHHGPAGHPPPDGAAQLFPEANFPDRGNFQNPGPGVFNGPHQSPGHFIDGH